jgi:hypothetical protein
MSFPKKKSRRIQVEGRAYRYLVKTPTNTDPQRHAGGRLILIQADTEKPGQILRTSMVIESVTPSLIINAIRQGIAKGWDPYEPGAVFDI